MRRLGVSTAKPLVTLLKEGSTGAALPLAAISLTPSSCSSSVFPSTTSSISSTAMSTPCRTIYPSFSAIACEPWATKESWLTRLLSRHSYRSFDVLHSPQATTPAGLQLSSVETYLLSRILDDTERLRNLSWTYDLDPYWVDALYSHEELFKTLYVKGQHSFRALFLGDCSSKTKEKQYIESKLNTFASLVHWAQITEETYTSIYKVRFMMQRTVYNQLERERYLCGCVEAVEAVRAKVPEELYEKVMGELDLYLTNLRHWVNGCPVGKATFTRQLA